MRNRSLSASAPVAGCLIFRAESHLGSRWNVPFLNSLGCAIPPGDSELCVRPDPAVMELQSTGSANVPRALSRGTLYVYLCLFFYVQ